MFRYWDGTKQVRRSMGTEDESEAVREAAKLLQAPKLVETSNYEAEIALYFEIQRKADRLSRQSIEARSAILPLFFEQTGKMKVLDVRKSDVQQWYESRTCKEDTRQTYVRWIRAFYKSLIERGRIRSNPCDGVKMGRMRPAARRSTITKDQVALLIEQCTDESLKFVLFCGFHAGMRKHEAIEARPEWFDLGTGHIHIGPTPTWLPKDRERRSVPLSKAFKAFLATYGLRTPYMLAPDVRPGKSIYRYDFERAYKKHIATVNSKGEKDAAEAGVKWVAIKCTFHDARRTFASQLVSAGVSVYKVARWLGDGVAVVEKHYGHLQPDNGDLERGFA